MEKLHRLGAIDVRMAIAAADRIALRLPIAIVGDEQIQTAVVVVINPRRGNGPKSPQAGRTESRLLCHIGEGAVAVVAIKPIAMHTHDEQILMSVVVVVTDRNTNAVTLPGQAGLFRDIAERAVAVVAERSEERRVGKESRARSES